MEQDALLTAVMRSLGATWRAIRLYPGTSPMTREAAERVCAAVDAYVQAEPSLRLDVVREGFILRGVDGILSAPGVPDLTDALGAHGIGELHFVAPPQPDEVLELLSAALLQPHELHSRGGMQKALTKQGVTAIKVVSVVLSKVELPPEIPEEEADKFLAELAADSDRLAVWLGSLLAADDEGLAEGLLMLADAAGDVRVFGRTLAAAFRELDADDTDRLLESSIHLEPIRHVAVEMLANLSATELVAAIRGGRYGENVSGLAFALTSLPLGERAGEVATETQDALRSADTSTATIDLLSRLVRARLDTSGAVPLADADPMYHRMLEDSMLHPDLFDATLAELAARKRLDAGAIATVLRLLDTADDPLAYSRVLGALSRAVPHLLSIGEPALSMTVVEAIYERSMSADKPWPGLDVMFARAMGEACGMEAMTALLGNVAADEQTLEFAQEFLAFGGETASLHLAAASVRSEDERSLECAERVLGRRLPELIAPEAPTVDARHAAKLAEMCAIDGNPGCMQALLALSSRPEDKVRAETARGLAAAGGQGMLTHMPHLLRDGSSTVSLTAARALIRERRPEAVGMIVGCLGDYEGAKDLTVPEEMIRLVASSGLPGAREALAQVADKGSRMRRGRGSAIKRLAKEALKNAPQGGGS